MVRFGGLSSMRRYVPLLFLFVSVFEANAQGDSVTAEVEKIAGESGMKTASIGFCLIPIDGETASSVAAYREDTGLIPASTMKAITTATAVEVLGSDFKFVTELQITGAIDDAGTLKGHVVVKGGGDPTLGESGIAKNFARWKAALVEAGVKKVEGSVVGDASIYGTQRIADTWQWNDFGNYYGAGASGLSFHQNQFYCTFRTSSVGRTATLIGTDPKLPGIEFFNEMKVGPAGSGDQGYIYGAPYGKVFYLRGTVPAGNGTYTIKGALPDSAFFCARGLTKYLNENGLPVSGEPTTDRLWEESLGERRTLFSEESATLGDLLVLTNHKSNNLRAECIHRMIGVEAKGSGTIEASISAIEAHWREKGIDLDGFFMTDGCGLSRSNTVTPRQITAMLYYAAKAEEFDTFYASLPTAGQSGTLRSIGGGSAASGRVRAKSGTLDRVRNYAGYLNARSGKRYAFAIFINNYTGSLSFVKAKIVRVWNRAVIDL